ncbi:MAG: hypothetical protein U9R39_06475 [Campylobacterota bacterium]|nr:hypothetical protein [Campylobacterota bacterium]
MSLYEITLSEMKKNFNLLHSKIEEPEYIELGSHKVFRYKNKSANIAMIQYMARVISGLYSTKLLIENTFIQECNTLFRTIDEFNQNISFLGYSLIDNEITPLQQTFLDNFFQEEFDNPENAFLSTQKRGMVSRDKIRAYISQKSENPVNQSDTQKNYEIIDKFYSGFVHGTSVSILDMYSVNPSKYHLNGLSYEAPSVDLAKQYFEDRLYESILSLSFIALSFKEHDIFQNIQSLRFEFERQTSRDEYEDPNIGIKKMKVKNK